MSDLIEVAFKGNRKEFFKWEDVVPPPAPPAHVIVEGDRGEDLGQVHAIGELAEKRFAGVAHGRMIGEATRRIVRLATRDEIRQAQALTEENETTRRAAMAQVRALGLQMKLTDADWQWDHRKLTLFFTAEKRVDFRTLVRDLAATFKARIELKQIGVRDEAKRLDGIGRCGRQYCSASWLPDLRPVNLGVAKEQKLSLNPTQISGACGRLMCCLRYEHEFYVQSRKRFPKEGKIITTAKGEEKVMLNDIFHDRVTLRGADGETRILTLVELRRETSTWTPGVTEEHRIADASDLAEEGVLAFDDAPTVPERTRLPASDRTLPVLPTAKAPPATAQPKVAATLRVTDAPPVDTPKAAATPETPAAPRVRPLAVPPTAASAPATPPVAAPVSASSSATSGTPPVVRPAGGDADSDPDDADDGDTDDGDESTVGSDAADAANGEAPKRRRRRGRRGGRRGRGSRPSTGDDSPAQ
jgi:cell fate regulator YaaT (PSP1 superfamily)